MDLLKSHKSRSRLSHGAYIGLNIALAGTLFGVIYLWQAVWLAVVILLIGKWRVFAVRPRFWFANIVSNTVDIIVGLSAIVFLTALTGNWIGQVVIATLFAGWLIFIKPRSKRQFVVAQAGIAVFCGITALSMVTYEWDVVVFVLVMWIIGYVSARHVLGSYEESQVPLLSILTGFIYAEIGWFSYYWLMAYDVLGLGELKLSQLAIFVFLFSLIAERAYNSRYEFGKVRRVDVLPAVVLTIAIVSATFIFAIIFGIDAL